MSYNLFKDLNDLTLDSFSGMGYFEDIEQPEVPANLLEFEFTKNFTPPKKEEEEIPITDSNYCKTIKIYTFKVDEENSEIEELNERNKLFKKLRIDVEH